MSAPTASVAWPEILEQIRAQVSKQQYATWFQNLKVAPESNGELHIRVPNNFFKDWLAQNYQRVISDCAARVTGEAPAIQFVLDASAGPVESSDEPADDAPPPAAAQPGTASVQGLRLNDHYTFDSFVIGPSNQLAHAASMAVAESPGKTYNPLFIYGSTGLGKSHLLQAICHASLAHPSRRRIAYLSCETFVNEFISAIQRNDLPAFRQRYRLLDLLFIDDIQFLARAERSQEEFFHTFNDLYNAQKQIVISSDQPPQDLSGLQERMISRFKSGLVARVDPPSYEMRVAILNKKADLRSVAVPEEVIQFIAEVVTANIRELDGAITKVLGYASLLNEPITLSVARMALHDPAIVAAPTTVEDIMRVVAAHYNVRVADLQSKRRTRSIVFPRQICMYLARTLTGLSLQEIGGHFGGRDHSTVIHAEDKIQKEAQADPVLAQTLEDIKRGLNITSMKRSTDGG